MSREKKVSTQDSLSPLEDACLSVVSNQLFNSLIKEPTRANKDSRQKTIEELEAVLPELDPSVIEGSLEQLQASVAIVSRGKHLVRRTSATEKKLAVISQAILTGQCLKGHYNRRERLLHPYALVVREPKIYLLATEDASTVPAARAEQNAGNAPAIQQFLCNRFEDLTPSKKQNAVPVEFNLDEYLTQGGLDIPITALKSSLPDLFTLELRIRADSKDNFVRDLEEFPLSSNQSLVKQDSNGYFLLEVPKQKPTISLVEWILGRQDRVEILAPLPLRQYLIGRLNSVTQLYTQSDDPSFESTHTLTQVEAPPSKKPSRLGLGSAGNTELGAANEPTIKLPQRSLYAKFSLKNSLVSQLIVLLLKESTISVSTLEDDEDMNTVKRYLPKKVRTAADTAELTCFETELRAAVKDGEDMTLDSVDPFTVNTTRLACMLDMGASELAILRIATLLNHNAGLKSAFKIHEPDVNDQTLNDSLALLTGYSAELIEYNLREDQLLKRSGLISRNPLGIWSAKDGVKIAQSVVNDLLSEQLGNRSILTNLSNVAPPSTLSFDDLEHVATQVRQATNLLKRATATQTKGFNILLWGVPGSGKTEIARYLVQSLKLTTFEVQTVDPKGNSLTEVERLSSYRLCQSLLATTENAALIFDEIENILYPSFTSSEEVSKAYINQTLDENSVPSIWISNHVAHADPAYLRRFDFIIELNGMDVTHKRRLASRMLSDIPISGELLEEFLLRQEIGPAAIAKLKHLAELSGLTDQEDIDELALTLVQGDLAAVGAKPLSVSLASSANQAMHLPYDESMLNADVDLAKLTSTMNPDASFKLLMYGPPGTGKSAWAKYLGVALGKPVHIHEASDIKGMFLGESEKNVARAFERASTEKAVLIFDEVDTYLRSRTTARDSHEKDLANQFLTSIDNYAGILVCSTNLLDTLDPAALSRFYHKVKFDYLKASQATRLLTQVARMLDIEVDSENIIKEGLSLPDQVLAPRDFANQLRRANVSNSEITLEELVAELMKEADMRNPPSQRIGFI